MMVICWNRRLDRLTLHFKRCHLGQLVDNTVNYVLRVEKFFFFARWIYVLIGCLHKNIMPVNAANKAKYTHLCTFKKTHELQL